MEPYLLSIQLHVTSTLERHSPATLAAATAAWQHAQRAARQLYGHSLDAGEGLWQRAEPHVRPYTEAADEALARAFGGWHPWQVSESSRSSGFRLTLKPLKTFNPAKTQEQRSYRKW